MNIDLTPYAGKRICVACSGGRDSMALLHYLKANSARFNIALCALNCDHAMRGEESARDSAFVIDYCKKNGIPLIFFRADEKYKNEASARFWRVFRCYAVARLQSDSWENDLNYRSLGIEPIIYSSDGRWRGCDCVATAHHMDDNAETVLFNLARGSGLSGLCGIRDENNSSEGYVIHPLVATTRTEIDEYVRSNGIEYVDDATNFTNDYTRNFIRHNVLPALERAVPGATRAIYRFSRLAAEDEDYFARMVKNIVAFNGHYGYKIARCGEPVIFKRAALYVVERYGRKDYTSLHAQKLYDLQSAPSGKKFSFLGLDAQSTADGIVIFDPAKLYPAAREVPFCQFGEGVEACFGGQIAAFGATAAEAERLAHSRSNMPLKTLMFDGKKLPAGAVVRNIRQGDRFTKFGGGTKSAGDFLTDRKIPAYLRPAIPVIAFENEIFVICGVEISQKVRVDDGTPPSARMFVASADYSKL